MVDVTLRNLGHTQVEFYEMAGLDHGTVEKGAMIIAPAFVRRVLQAGKQEKASGE